MEINRMALTKIKTLQEKILRKPKKLTKLKHAEGKGNWTEL